MTHQISRSENLNDELIEAIMHTTFGGRKFAEHALCAINAVYEKHGLVVLPKNPNRLMLNAAYKSYEDGFDATSIYYAMIEAAQQEQGGK